MNLEAVMTKILFPFVTIVFEVPIFLYHCKDDEEIPFAHFERYKQKITQANFREIENGGHQLNNDLPLIAADIQSL